MLKPPSPNAIEDVLRSKGYAVFLGPSKYNLNIVGIRSNDTLPNRFDDWLCVMYVNDDVWNCFSFPQTTDPGNFYRKHPMNVDGTAVLKPGQYRCSHELGLHRGRPALVQRRPVIVYRDANLDDNLDLDEDRAQAGMFGIDIHGASQNRASTVVDKWSAGCQVLQDPIHLRFLIDLARKSASIYGNSFTYTLLTEHDFE